MKKKTLSIFLSLALIFSAVPFTSIVAFATGDECSTYGHSYVEIYRLEATCETDGYIEYICQVCSGDSYQEPIPATGHNYAHLYTQDATCSQDGWSEYACMNCGNSYTDDFIPAYGCEMFASPQTPVGPFCDSYGFVEYKCDLCGKVVFTELIKDGKAVQMKIYGTTKVTGEDFAAMLSQRGVENIAPGTILSDGRTYLAFVTADGALSVNELQLAGKKRMTVKDFLIGFRDPESYSTSQGTSSQITGKKA